MTLPITIISAGAGSGKTYTLTQRMVALLKTGVRPAGIIATTFTQKAAAELQERVRVKLLEDGLHREANELGNALIGTVHSIGVKLLQRFAFEAGVSPLVEIIADGDEQRLFNESLSQVLTEKRIETMNRLADRLGLTKSKFGAPYDWRRLIRELTDVARANNFSRAVLESSKQYSWESFEALLPPPSSDTELSWQNRLVAQLEQTIAALDAQTADETKKTRDAAERLRSIENQLKNREELYWYEWVQIAKIDVGAKSRDLVEDLRQFALGHGAHPRFRADIKQFIDLVFDIAMDALGEYAQYKKKRGLIDYTDMETFVSQLLRNDAVRDTLRDEIDLLLVDEFQDTSPIQLDIFLQLSRLAKHSIWVGDPKQSIYGFRGAEPALMQAIVRATGGVRDENILKISWRSRPELVYTVNAIFKRAFPDLPEEQIVLSPAQAPPTPPMRGGAAYGSAAVGKGWNDPAESRAPAPPLMGGAGGAWAGLHHWHFLLDSDERKSISAEWLDGCIAGQIGVLLERGLPVYSKNRQESRPIRPGDIAVLCRSNAACQRMAEALHRAGLKASIARAGLLETIEARLVLACLKYLLSALDTLSTAEILLLTGAQTLEDMVDDRLEWLSRQQESEQMSTWAATNPYIRQINALRAHTADLSASEILNLLLDELDLRRVVVRFGHAAQRLDNVDRLRRYALDYESACNRLHTAASLGGFLLWLDELGRQGADEQGSGESPDAVKVLTYHKSKGLEFPLTIVCQLDDKLKEKVWGLNLVSESEPDLDNILGGRRLRYWVNPYDDQIHGTALEEALQQSEAYHTARRQALEEEARLLYVGLTRARDYLVFPTTTRPTRWLNRVFNRGDESIPTLDPHSDETPFYHDGQPLYIQTEVVLQPRELPEAPPQVETVPFHPPHPGRRTPPYPARWIDPATELPPGQTLHLGEPIAFAPWLEFKGDYDPAIGEALKALCMAHTPPDLALASALLQRYGLRDALRPEYLLRQAEALRRFGETRNAGARQTARYPLEAAPGERRLRVEVDIWLESNDKIVAVQFAPFADGMKKWKTQAQGPAHLLAWARWAAAQAFPGKQFEGWVAFGVEGQIVR